MSKLTLRHEFVLFPQFHYELISTKFVDVNAEFGTKGVKKSSPPTSVKLTAALNLFPDNAEYLSLRGQAYLKLDKKTEACADLRKAKETLFSTWYDNLLPILCKEEQEEEKEE